MSIFFYYTRSLFMTSSFLISLFTFRLYLLCLTKYRISGIDSARFSSLFSILIIFKSNQNKSNCSNFPINKSNQKNKSNQNKSNRSNFPINKSNQKYVYQKWF